jgi:hypothetical protein
MKIIIITLLGLSALVSCKKKYNCECATKKTFAPYQENGAIYDFYYEETTSKSKIKDKKEDAKASCAEGSKTYYEPGPYAQNGQDPTLVVTTCAIK